MAQAAHTRYAVIVSEECMKRIDTAAQQMDLTRSQLIRRILDEWLAKNELAVQTGFAPPKNIEQNPKREKSDWISNLLK